MKYNEMNINVNSNNTINNSNYLANIYSPQPVHEKKYKNITSCFIIEEEKIKYSKKKILIKNLEMIFSSIPEGILLFNHGLEINYANDKFKDLFNIKGDSPDEILQELLDPGIYEKIKKFINEKIDKSAFEWIIENQNKKILIKIILKYISPDIILLLAKEINDVLAGKELDACYYIIRGYSERETAKILYKSRTTINSNKVRAKDKLAQNNYLSLINKL
jgi:DNA-binding CsgD family transcriptional regulator